MGKVRSTPLTCEFCGKQNSVRVGRRYCSRVCAGSAKRRLRALCEECGTKRVKQARSRFCSPACQQRWMSERRASSEWRANQSRVIREWHERNPEVAEAASKRMVRENPMRDKVTRAKVSHSLREMGHAPPMRGGNGRPMPTPQRLLLEALGSGWVAEHVVVTRAKRVLGGLPTHYKIDIASPDRMIAIEVDGPSHSSLSRKVQDQRKTTFLESYGWTVFRVPNQRILNDLESVLALLAE